jgi:hypothetical protein
VTRFVIAHDYWHGFRELAPPTPSRAVSPDGIAPPPLNHRHLLVEVTIPLNMAPAEVRRRGLRSGRAGECTRGAPALVCAQGPREMNKSFGGLVGITGGSTSEGEGGGGESVEKSVGRE